MGFLWNNLYNNGISWYNHQTIWEYIGILIPGNTINGLNCDFVHGI